MICQNTRNTNMSTNQANNKLNIYKFEINICVNILATYYVINYFLINKFLKLLAIIITIIF